MKIEREENGHKGAFFITKDGKRAGEMTYTMAGESRMIIDHTEVKDSLRGEGAGKKLVHAGVEFARENGLEVIPLCPFARSVIEKEEQER
ncbi:MAG TPA: GNAT family N-acetyltransferase [Aridibacter sp.]|nr:GNAT family N-acetyltransferase [Aridibacter sp.]